MKKRTLNEYRQTKEYQGSQEGRKYLDDLEKTKEKWDTSKHGGVPVELYDLENTKEEKLKKLEEAHKIPEEIKEITLKQQMEEIAERVVSTVNDIIYNEIIETMDDYEDLNWSHFVQDDAPTALLDACFDHKTEIHYEIFQLVLQKLK